MDELSQGSFGADGKLQVLLSRINLSIDQVRPASELSSTAVIISFNSPTVKQYLLCPNWIQVK